MTTPSLSSFDILDEQTIRILDSIFDGILIINTDTVVIYVNPEYLRIVRIEAKEIIGKPLLDVRPGARLPEVVRSGRSVEGAYRREGDVEYVVDMSPMYHDGQIIGGISVVKDVTEVQRLSVELARFQRSNKQLRSKLRSINTAQYTFNDIVGESTAIQQLVRKAKSMATGTVDILISGESGTGKEVFAQAVHNASPRARGPFLALNCATLAPNFIESELFGYGEGAFTGAKRGGKEGFFEVADGGTLFLDEVTELSVESQAKLLRVLQERTVRRMGETNETPMNVRVVAASNRNMSKLVHEGLFRSDLYYRLNALQIEIPPLRERREDILPLAVFFASRIWRMPENTIRFDPDAALALKRYSWPGNVRELRNAIEYAAHMEAGGHVVPASLPANIFSLADTPARTNYKGLSLEEITAQAEKEAITAMLQEYGETLAAKKTIAAELDISLTTLYTKINKYRL